MINRLDHKAQLGPPQANEQPTSALSTETYLGPSLGLLDDASTGYPVTESKDVEILRRLKLAILEGQHPYFKANVNVSSLQDLILPAPAPIPLVHNSTAPSKTLPEQASADLGNTARLTSPATVVENQNKSHKSETTVDKHPKDTEMKNIEPNPARISSQDSGASNTQVSSGDTAAAKKATVSGSLYTLGQHTLLSPVEPGFTNHPGRGRSTSDASTVIDLAQPNAEVAIQAKDETARQPAGSQPLSKDPTSSSLSSIASTATTSTVLTSENGADGDDSVKSKDGDLDLSGYDPKYGNKADYLRHQKARVKMRESVEEKSRGPGSRPDERPQPRSPPRQTQATARRNTGPPNLPTRELEYVPRTGALPPPSRSSSIRDISPRRSSTMDMVKDHPLPPNVRPSPRRAEATSFSRTASPPGRYAPLSRPREYSPSREIRPQYLPYDDPVSVPVRPRPVVSSPPRGSPPREVSAPRATDRQGMDDYPGSLRRNEARSYDFRPGSASSVFAERQNSRDNGAFDDAWAVSARGPPLGPPSRDSPPHLERTSFTSSNLLANPTPGYRPQVTIESSGAPRYAASYDPAIRRPDTWAAREWDGSRPPETKPKLQDRFSIQPAWPRDGDRDDFHPRSRERDGYRREPSPVFSDGLRSGFRRPSDIETGMRPMKRSRPDEGYASRLGSGPDRARYELDGRPSSDYYAREPIRRLDDDDYIPRTRSAYDSWGDVPP